MPVNYLRKDSTVRKIHPVTASVTVHTFKHVPCYNYHSYYYTLRLYKDVVAIILTAAN